MGWKKNLLHLATLSFTLSLGFLLIPRLEARVQAQQKQLQLAQRIPGSWEVAQAFQPPNRGAPSSTAGGASRGSQCANDPDAKLSLTALMPANKFGLTVRSNPKFFFYIPATSARTVEFVLKDEQDLDIYRQTFAITGKAGIVSFSPFAELNIPPLEKDKNYKWQLALRCNIADPINDPFVEGWVQRIEPSSTLAEQLKQTQQERDRLALYAKNGIWYEAVTTILELPLSDPNYPALAASWQELLKSVGLEKIAKEPLINCCSAATTSASP